MVRSDRLPAPRLLPDGTFLCWLHSMSRTKLGRVEGNPAVIEHVATEQDVGLSISEDRIRQGYVNVRFMRITLPSRRKPLCSLMIRRRVNLCRLVLRHAVSLCQSMTYNFM